MKFEVTNALDFLPQDFLTTRQEALAAAQEGLRSGSCPGGDFTGWVALPETYDKEEFSRILDAAARIRAQSSALVVIGIGGSYLGARAMIELLEAASDAPVKSSAIHPKYMPVTPSSQP